MSRFSKSVEARMKRFLTMALAVMAFTMANAQVTPHPTIGGSVFGGGRMADVDGNTTVTVVNCDTISAVYGGNDIAGTVGGANGSTIQIGTAATDALIRIGSVYGGGNGYYIYGGGSEFTGATLASFTGGVKAMNADGEPVGESFLASGTIPSILKTSITILPAGADADHVQRVRIGELFGGAKNAFVTATSNNSTNIVINGGTIYAVFGGNNYGGTLGAGSIHKIVLNNSTTTSTENVVNGDWTGFGREWGIRYLYGGGNKVEAQNVVISMTGGQVDTLFAGGNSADLAENGTATVTINCGTPSTLITNALYPNAASWDGSSEYSINRNYTWNTKHVYNVRTLFGGNNAADMSGLPTLNLMAGHIGTAYGGGNAGAMLAKRNDTYTLTSRDVAKLRNDIDYDANTAISAIPAANQVYYSTRVHVGSKKMMIDYLYGGCQKSDVEWSTWVIVENGHVGTVYGGCNISGDVGSKHSCGGSPFTTFNTQIGTYVEVFGGTVYGNVFAGSNGYYHCNDGYKYVRGINYDDPEENYIGTPIPTHNETHVRVLGTATIYGDLYAGANLANVGFDQNYSESYSSHNGGAESPYPVTVGLASLRMAQYATAMSNVYGGSNMAMIYSSTDIEVSGGTIQGALYGGNDKTGVISSAINNRNVGTRYASDGHTVLTKQNASSYLRIIGKPFIGTVYGGGNGAYDYSTLQVCENNMGEVQQPEQSTTFVDINIDAGNTTGLADYLAGNDNTYAGGGYIGRVFGGGNGVTVNEAITVLLNLKNYGTNKGKDNVGTIFGGNDKGPLAVIPEIILLNGQVNTVYGGCNRGDMLGKGTVKSYEADGTVHKSFGNVGSYVRLSEYYFYDKANIDASHRLQTDVVVSGSVFGGCNQADVGVIDPADVDGDKRKSSLVLVEGGDHTDARIFGGNDISGVVTDTARVYVVGGTVKEIYGGGNGDYIYNNDGTVYKNHHEVAEGISARPFCTNTEVILEEGHTLSNVYAGGLAGDCGDTRLLVEGNTTIDGQLFGGGRGDVDHIGIRPTSACGVERVGNVTGTAVTELISCNTASKMKRAYGGGHNGDCENTRITLHETFRQNLESIYGGCVASNVNGTANVIINGYDDGATRIVDTLYGGNDFSGKVQNTVMTVNSGRFITAFGAGNGDYDYTGLLKDKNNMVEWEGPTTTSSADEPVIGSVNEGLKHKNETSTLAGYNDEYDHIAVEVSADQFKHIYRYWNLAEGCQDTVPYSMNVNFTINGGTFLYSIYGGGNMGLVGDRDMVADTMHSTDAGRGDHMGLIQLNVHGGDFHRHIFTGASGRPGMKGSYFDAVNYHSGLAGATTGNNVDGNILGKQLVYGLKIFNMDGGKVEFSVYGGSESVDDGYPYECIGRKDPNLYTGFPHHETVYLKSDGTASLTEGGQQYTYVPGDINSTMRPSSILNIVGGIVEKSIYGGGYQGNIYGSVYVNIGRDAVDDSPVWTKEYGTDNGSPVTFAALKPNLTNLTGQLNIAGRVPLTTGKPLMLNTSVYNASDWGEARDNPYFNTRGVFGGETNILIDGRGYRTTLRDPRQSLLPSMNIAYSIIGSGTSTEGGDIHRLITMRHYGDYYDCPNISKELASIQRADKVILDSVFINLAGEQDAFSAYASPNYSLCRIDTLLFRQDNIVSIESPGIFVGNLVSMKDTVEILNFTYDTTADFAGNKLYTNQQVVNTVDNGGLRDGHTYSNDLLDNLFNLHHTQGDDNEDCGDGTDQSACQDYPICQRLSANRGMADNMGAYNTLVLRNGSYLKISPYIDMKDDAGKWWVDPSGSGMNGKDDPAHKWGHVYGWMYLVAFDNTQSYVYADEKTDGPDGLNTTDGGFVATCDCDNIWVTSGGNGDQYEIDYIPVDASTDPSNPQAAYRIWRVGRNQGSRKRHITLVANAHPDNTLNYEMDSSNTCLPIVFPVHGASADCNSGENEFHTSLNNCSVSTPTLPTDVDGYTITTGSEYAYAVTTLELPPSSPGNFYIMTPPIIDLDNGGQLHLTDQVYESKAGVIFQAEDLYQLDNSGNLIIEDGKIKIKPVRTPMSAILDDPNYTFGLAFSTTAQGSNFSNATSCWMGSNGNLATINEEIGRHATSRNLNSCALCWPLSYISGNEYLSQAGGFVSKEIVGGEGSIPTMTFTLTYSKNLSTTITRDITYVLEEYTATGEYVGPVEITVTINTVIKEMDDLEAPVLAMYNEGITNEYVRKVTIPASFVQRDLYLEGFSWDLAPARLSDDVARKYFNLQDTNNLYYPMDYGVDGTDQAKLRGHIKDNKTFAIVVNPTESSSEHLTNHLGWYHIERQNIDLFAEAYKDRTNNTYHYYNESDPTWPSDIDAFKEKNTTDPSAAGRSSRYSSFDFHGDGSTPPNNTDTTAIGTKAGGNRGIQIGTLDGRATASVDVRLLFDGLRVYRNYFPEPLGEIKLHMHWYNNKISREDIEKGVQTDGTFDIIIKLRTRESGDTIYMAWGDAEMQTANSCKPKWFYKTSGGGETEVTYDANGDPDLAALPANITVGKLYNRTSDYIQRKVTKPNGDPISATPNECIATVHSYKWHCDHNTQDYNKTLTNDKDKIYNNPDSYLTNFEDVMKIYQEGDVIDIMQTIPVRGGDNDVAQAISGTDYSIIQLIRYSGSHFKFPSLGCANYDPLIDVTGTLNMRNVWFNGSGCTRTKTYMYTSKSLNVTTHVDSIMPKGIDENTLWLPNSNPSSRNDYIKYNKSTSGTGDAQTVTGYTETPISTGTATTAITAPAGYYDRYRRDKVMLPVHAPMIYVHDGGSCNFSANVRLTNNLNVGVPEHMPWYYADGDPNVKQHFYSPTTYSNYTGDPITYSNCTGDPIPGGAIAVIRDNRDRKPTMQLGNRGTIYGNTVIDPYTTGTGEVDAHNALTLTNSGAGVYVYGGTFSVGSNTSVSKLNIEHNFYLKATEDQIKSASSAIIQQKVAIYTTDEDDQDHTIQVNYYELDTVGSAENYYSLNNVYLTRTYNRNVTPLRPVRVDNISDVVRFRGSLTSDSKIGITKWFPGYIYNNRGAYRTNNYNLVPGTYTELQYHPLYNTIPRDTIGFAVLTSGSTVVASYVYDSAAFFNDSVYFARNSTPAGERSFVKSADDLVLYGGNTTANPNFNDHVYLFHHDYLDPSRLYFQRCASFGKGVKQTLVELTETDPLTGQERRYTINDYMRGDSIAYWWNKDATCVASTDTIVFKVGGGFFPYTYHWDMDSIVYHKGETLVGYQGSALGTPGTGTSSTLALKRIPIRDRVTFGTNAIANLSSERFDQLRAKARIDTLVLTHLHMDQQLIRSTYLYEVTATDLTGRCPVNQTVMVRVGKITSEGRDNHKGDYFVDSVNFLRHRNPYAAYVGYKDEYSDQAGFYTEFPTALNENYTGQNNNLEVENDPYQGAHIQDDRPNYTGSSTWSNELKNVFSTPRYIHRDGRINTDATDPYYQVNDYLYYRLNAPGVDSSSFHDHVDYTTMKDNIAPDVAANLGKDVTVFLNSHKAYVSGEHHYSDDYLYPYIRPWFPSYRAITAEDLKDSKYPLRDTLGYEIRIYDTTFTGDPAVASVTVHRFRWNKRDEEGHPLGVYYKSGSESLSTAEWRALPWQQLGSGATISRSTEDFYPTKYVPYHTHGTGNAGDGVGSLGIRRAGYSHNPMHWYNHGNNRGTLEQRIAAEQFKGMPYRDKVAINLYGIDDVKYVKEVPGSADANGKPTWQDDNEGRSSTLYASEMVPRYLRIYRSYKVTPHIEPAILGYDRHGAGTPENPVGEGAKVWAWETYETNHTEANRIDLSTAEFCPGGVVHLSAFHPDPTMGDTRYQDINQSVDHARWEYQAWDFDPSSLESTNFVVSADPDLNHPTVYYVPGDYWYQTVTTYEDEKTKAQADALSDDVKNRTAFDFGYIDPTNQYMGDYHEDYDGNIEIYTEKGLAWLISKVNGFNSMNARTFRFNTITLDHRDAAGNQINTPFDMSAHKWTPLGNIQNNFEGLIVGATDDNDATTDVDERQTVANLRVNETSLPFIGMFGYTDNARIRNFRVQGSQMKGNMYVGGLIGQSTENTEVTDMALSTNILFGEYVMGGAIAKAVNTTVDKLRVTAPVMYGNAIYAGGGIGTMESTEVDNTSIEWYDAAQSSEDSARVRDLSAVFYNGFNSVNYGGLAGNIDNPTGGGKSVNSSTINNNYIHLRSGSNNQRVGGIVGSAAGISLNNNYVYGDAKSSEYVGGLIGYVGNDVSISNCYFVDGMTGEFIGSNAGNAMPKKSTTFRGSGNAVNTNAPIDGINNLTRILNRWVDQSGDTIYLHWRSDLENENNGYPVFGTPDLIPVRDSLVTEACDEMDWDGMSFTESGRYIFHVVDSSQYIDSTFTLVLTVNQSDTVYVSDTITIGEGYEGYGFTVSDEEVRDEMNHDGRFDIRQMIRMDSLYNVHGCDSVVVLTLYVLGNGQGAPEVQKLAEVKVYPNPTLGIVNVEGSDLQSVEVYDNISRRVLQYKGFTDGDNSKYVFDLSDRATGAYYVRVRTAHGTVVKKVIKK